MPVMQEHLPAFGMTALDDAMTMVLFTQQHAAARFRFTP
jgi:hypothetical protein